MPNLRSRSFANRVNALQFSKKHFIIDLDSVLYTSMQDKFRLVKRFPYLFFWRLNWRLFCFIDTIFQKKVHPLYFCRFSNFEYLLHYYSSHYHYCHSLFLVMYVIVLLLCLHLVEYNFFVLVKYSKSRASKLNASK